MRIYKIAEDIIPTYCAWCKKHMKGKDVGIGSSGVSHGICPECYRKMMGSLDEGDDDTPTHYDHNLSEPITSE